MTLEELVLNSLWIHHIHLCPKPLALIMWTPTLSKAFWKSSSKTKQSLVSSFSLFVALAPLPKQKKSFRQCIDLLGNQNARGVPEWGFFIVNGLRGPWWLAWGYCVPERWAWSLWYPSQPPSLAIKLWWQNWSRAAPRCFHEILWRRSRRGLGFCYPVIGW